MTIKSSIGFFIRKPKTLFLVDGLGAALTACILFFVLRNFSDEVGMPANMLTLLSVIAFVYAAYSLCCYFFLNDDWNLYLSIISSANFLYCMLTMGLLCFYYNDKTQIGLLYFLLEMVVILLLAFIECSVAKRLSGKERA